MMQDVALQYLYLWLFGFRQVQLKALCCKTWGEVVMWWAVNEAHWVCDTPTTPLAYCLVSGIGNV
jgi:hypothetical protein